MPSWKKILQSGSAVHVLNITASSLPTSSQPNIIGYDTASGRFTYFSTSSIAGGTSGTGTENYITRWSSGTTITTSSIYESSSRIGIGTTSPQGTLHIRGVSDNGVTPGIFLDSNGFDNNEPFDIRLASAGVGAAQARGIRIIASSSLSNFAGGAAISFYNITSSAFPGWVLIDSGAHNSAKILFRTAATNGAISTGERMVISSSGNVGIGTSTPTTTLNVNGTTLLQGGQTTVRGDTATSAATALRVENNNATSLLTILNDGTSAFNTSHLYVSSSGRVGIGTTSPSASLHISGASNSNLFRVSSPTNQNILFVTGSGLVGIGTTTPGVNLDVSGDIRASSGMFNSTTQTQTIRINSTTHLAFQNTGSVEVARFNNAGNWGIGTTSPTERLHVDGNMIVTGRITAEEFHTEFVSASIIYQSGSTQFGNSSDDTHIFTGSLRVNGSITGSLFGTASVAVNAQTASFLSGAFLQNGNSFGATAILGTNDTQNLQFETSGSVRMTISSSGNIGIGTTTPTTTLDVVGNIKASSGIEGLLFATNNYVSSDSVFTNLVRGYQSASFGVPGIDFPTTAIVHISGANNQNLLRVSSPTNQNILFVNGNGIVGINTTSSMALLSGSGGGFVSGEGNIIPTLTIFQSSSSTGLNSAGLQIVGSGSSPFAAARLNILTMGDKYAYLNIGTSGSGTQNNYWEFAKRPSSINHRLVLSNYSNGVHNGTFMNLAPGADTSYIGAQSQISLEGNTGNIGIQTSAGAGTQEYIHLYSIPFKGKYIRIDAAQSSNDPPLRNTGNDYTNIYGPGTDTTPILGEPDYWMEIKLDGTVVLIPCYLPA